MKKSTTIGVPINSIKHLDIRYNETECLRQEPLFMVHRFSVRNIKIQVNGLNEYVHCYLVTGFFPIEKILICLIERHGNIVEVKSCFNLQMDKELAGYITKATVSRLSESFDFRLKNESYR